MIVWKDRIGKQIMLGPWWCRLTLGWHSAAWFGSLHMFRRPIWLRPINYRAIEAHNQFAPKG